MSDKKIFSIDIRKIYIILLDYCIRNLLDIVFLYRQFYFPQSQVF